VPIPVAPSSAAAGRSGAGWLGAAIAVLAATNGVIFPLLADLQDAHGLPTYGLGLMSAATFLVGLAAQLALAPQADRGASRRLLLAGLAAAVASQLWLTAATELWEFVAARALAGLAVGCFVPAARAVVATLDPQHVGRNLGRLASAELGGFVCGPLVGAVVAEQVGLHVPFAVLAVAAAAMGLALARQSLPTPATAQPAGVGGPLAPMARLVRRPGVQVAALLGLALYLPVGIYDSLWARYLEDRGASTLFVGASLTLYGVPFVLLAGLGGRLVDRWGPARSAAVALAPVALLTAAYGAVEVPMLIAGISLVEAVLQAGAVPGAQAAMARACPPGLVAAGQGLMGALQLAGAGAAALLGAPVYEAAGSTAVFGGAAAVMALLGLLAWRCHRVGIRAREVV